MHRGEAKVLLSLEATHYVPNAFIEIVSKQSTALRALVLDSARRIQVDSTVCVRRTRIWMKMASLACQVFGFQMCCVSVVTFPLSSDSVGVYCACVCMTHCFFLF